MTDESRVIDYICGNGRNFSCPLCGIHHKVNLKCGHLLYCPITDGWYHIDIKIRDD